MRREDQTGTRPEHQHDEHVEEPPMAELRSHFDMGWLALRGLSVAQAGPAGVPAPSPRAAVLAPSSQR